LNVTCHRTFLEEKFEHNGKDGLLVVYGEDRKVLNEYWYFTVIITLLQYTIEH